MTARVPRRADTRCRHPILSRAFAASAKIRPCGTGRAVQGRTRYRVPATAPGDSFVAHLTLPRAGTFIYHTHLNDVKQLTSGLYGAIIVLEPGQRLDPHTDHLFVIGWDGPKDPPHLVVNGDSAPPPLVLARGLHHRLRFVFIGAVGGDPLALMSMGSPVTWRPLARDGYAIPASQQHEQRANVLGWAGQTYDFDFDAREPREYILVAGDPAKPLWSRAVIVR